MPLRILSPGKLLQALRLQLQDQKSGAEVEIEHLRQSYADALEEHNQMVEKMKADHASELMQSNLHARLK